MGMKERPRDRVRAAAAVIAAPLKKYFSENEKEVEICFEFHCPSCVTWGAIVVLGNLASASISGLDHIYKANRRRVADTSQLRDVVSTHDRHANYSKAGK